MSTLTSGNTRKTKREFWCHECDQPFTRSDNLQRHMKNIHEHRLVQTDYSTLSSSNPEEDDRIYSPLSMSPNSTVIDRNLYNFGDGAPLNSHIQGAQAAPLMNTSQNSLPIVPPSHVTLLPMTATDNDGLVEECYGNSTNRFNETYDPTEEQTAHILRCNSCWSKISKDVCSQAWMDKSLLIALQDCNADLLRQLILSGANAASLESETFFSKDKFEYGYTALHRAVSYVQSNKALAHAMILKILCQQSSILDKCANPSNLTALNFNCQFGGPFRAAGSRNLTAVEIEIRYKFIRIFLESGADANVPDREGRLPLHSFLLSSTSAYRLRDSQFSQILQLLVNKTRDLNAKTGFGSRPLILAADHCNSAIRPLLASGADPRLQSQDGTIAMHLVHSLTAFESLFERWPESIDCRSKAWGATPLHHAVVRGRTQVVEGMLRTRPAIVNQRTSAYLNSLHLTHRCYNNGHAMSILKLLLENGCDPNQRDKDGDTVIHMYTRQVSKPFEKRNASDECAKSLSSQNIKTRLEILISHGARVNELNADGHTAIALVLDRIFNLAAKIDTRWELQHEAQSPETIQLSAPYGWCQTRCKTRLEKHMFRMEEISNWIAIAKIMIEAGGEVLSAERVELIGKKPSKFNCIVDPLYDYLIGHGAFAHT